MQLSHWYVSQEILILIYVYPPQGDLNTIYRFSDAKI